MMSRKIWRTVEARFEEVLCALALAVTASCILTQVVMRVIVSEAAPWAEEAAVYGMVLAIYMGASLGVRERAHLRVLLMVNALPHRLRVASIVLADVIWLAFLLVLLWQFAIFLELAFSRPYITPGLGVPKVWFQLFVPAGLGLMIVRMAQVYYRWLIRGDGELPL
ncbi:TRAP transporter small permease [Spiribacter halobius]|uniref:TRAP transporter small permease protein n=1 Tax=Sediminicurvatus halobius TaxID=2182432 RepID=A0A2U2MX96_9GAMM|nr:TRAP transporter small permease [Spiribacter halobius]PWG61488.1 TRAP transporter small permease [Spiribacter halobius]UEX77974.1 TRAP transporter small permease [Spiribacter halobius]